MQYKLTRLQMLPQLLWLLPTSVKLKSMTLPPQLQRATRMLLKHTLMYRLLFKKLVHSVKISVPFKPNVRKLVLLTLH